MKQFIGLCLDVAFLVALYAWKVHGIEGARNLWIGYMVLHALLGTLFLLSSQSSSIPTEFPRVIVPLRWLGIGLDIAATVVMVWYGHFFMAFIPLYARLGAAVYRDAAEKKAAAASEASHG